MFSKTLANLYLLTLTSRQSPDSLSSVAVPTRAYIVGGANPELIRGVRLQAFGCIRRRERVHTLWNRLPSPAIFLLLDCVISVRKLNTWLITSTSLATLVRRHY